MAHLINPFIRVEQVDLSEVDNDMVELFLANGHVVSVYSDGRVDVQDREGYVKDEEIVHMHTEEMFFS